MNTISTALKQFVNDEDGVTAIEYGMIAALIATALVAGHRVCHRRIESGIHRISRTR